MHEWVNNTIRMYAVPGTAPQLVVRQKAKISFIVTVCTIPLHTLQLLYQQGTYSADGL